MKVKRKSFVYRSHHVLPIAGPSRYFGCPKWKVGITLYRRQWWRVHLNAFIMSGAYIRAIDVATKADARRLIDKSYSSGNLIDNLTSDQIVPIKV